MTPELLTLFGNFLGFGVVVKIVMDMRAEAREDRQWMKDVLWYLLQRDVPDVVRLQNIPIAPHHMKPPQVTPPDFGPESRP